MESLAHTVPVERTLLLDCTCTSEQKRMASCLSSQTQLFFTFMKHYFITRWTLRSLATENALVNKDVHYLRTTWNRSVIGVLDLGSERVDVRRERGACTVALLLRTDMIWTAIFYCNLELPIPTAKGILIGSAKVLAERGTVEAILHQTNIQA